MRTLQLTKVTRDEAEVLRQIAIATFVDTYGHANTPQNMEEYLRDNFNIERLRKELQKKDIHYYFARQGKDILGYLKLNCGQSQTEIKARSGLEIERIYVLSENKGKGIGRRFCDEALRLASVLGKSYVWLGVWEKNPKAIVFYEKYGFRAFDEHVFILGDEEQVDIMMKVDIDE